MCLNFTKIDSNTSALKYPINLWLNIFNMSTFIYYKGVRFLRTSAKASLKITPPLDEVIVGSILGDLTAERPNNNCNTRLTFKQSLVNKEYLLHLFSLFEEYCGSKPINLSYFDNRPDRMNTYKSIKFSTLSLPCFNIYRELFYNAAGQKIVPSCIKDLLTARGLAYWFCDDGYKATNGFYFATDSFTDNDLLLLLDVLRTKFELECGIHKTTNGYRIYIFSTSREKFISLVKPYMLEHFYYKLGLDEG